MDDELVVVFMDLLKVGLWGKKFDSSLKPLTEDEWEALYKYARNHTVEGIIFDSFSLIDDTLLPPKNILLRWTVRIDHIERYNKKMNLAINDQTIFFQEIGIQPILLKGQGVAACYLNPLRRVSGDVDWYLSGNDYNRALYEIKKKTEVKQPLDSFGFNWDGVDVDCHKRLFDIFSPFKRSYLDHLYKADQHHNQLLVVDNSSVRLLSPELQILQVNIHIFKHLLFLGIGLRQLCDSAMLYYRYHDKIDSEVLKDIYSKTGVLKWMHALHKVLVEYLGLPLEYLPFAYPADLDVRFMFDEIWYSGNFGFYDERLAEESNRNVGWLRHYLYSFRGIKLYGKYAPEEVFFFTIKRLGVGIRSLAKRESC